MSRCDEIRVLVSDLAAGEGVHESVGAHLSGCEPCRDHAEEIFRQDRVLAEMAVEARLETVLARVRESIRTSRQVRLTTDGRVRRAWLPWAVAAAAVLGIAAVLLWRPPSSGPEFTHAPKPSPRPPEPPRDLPAPEPPRDLPAPVPDPVPPPPKPPETKVVKAPPVAPPLEIPPDPVVKNRDVVQAREVVTPAPPPSPIDFRARTVDEAVRLGTAFLREKARGLGAANAGTGRDSRPDELVLWTMLHAGVPTDDAEFQRLFKGMVERKLDATYRVALQAMILEEVERVKYQGRILQCAQFLADNQCRNGQWSYGEPSMFAEEMTVAAKKDVAAGGAKVKSFGPPPAGVAKPKVTQKVQVKKLREGPDSGDNSNSMYAALGIRACFDAGVVFPQELIQLAAKAWRDALIKNPAVKGGAASLDGWCYGPKGHGHRGYGSMTAGAVGSLSIYDYVRDGERGTWKKDVEVQAGLDWLARNFSVESNPGVPEHGEGRPEFAYYYYMYALERAAILFGADRIGPHDWYARGSEAILGRQRRDGSWHAAVGGNEVSDTCFAILFLRKATRALLDVATGAPRKK